MSKSGMTTGPGPNGPRPGRKLPRNGEIVKKGYLKKMKTMRKKFFVLRAESSNSQACLEYYDSEKKFERHPNQPKRSIVLSTCFHINRRTDSKHKHAIALYTKRDVFCLVLDSASDLEDWLQNLLFLQHGQDLAPGEVLRPNYEYVWPVEMANRELGGNKNITGPYLLCLTDQSIILVKTGSNIDTDKLDNVEFSIHSIRCCGDYQTFFYLEVGTATVTGPGNLWMQVEDNAMAAHMHATVLKHCMTNSKKDANKNKDTKDNSQYHSTTRVRSPSVSEISRPIGINHTGSIHSQPYRTRTNSEGMQPLNQLLRCSYLDPKVGIQPHQFYKDLTHHSHHQLIGSPIISPTSDSAGSSLSLDNVDGGANDNSTVRSHHSLSDDYSGTGTTGHGPESYVMWNAEKRKEDERLNNYLTDNNLSSYHQTRKISPSSPSQASFLDVYSPYGSSPMDHNNSYFPMSPVSAGENKNRVLNGCLSVSHSRGSSITEDGYDTGGGYMHMDKKYNPRHHHDTLSSVMSPGGSSNSMTSGTPSKDLQLSDYHLDRVPSYLTPAEEESEDNKQDNRQKRAYSVGSRPENLKNKVNKNETQDCSRTRAFSVGSKVGVGGGTKPRLPAHSSSQSSLEHSEDWMEIDFSHSKQKSRGRHSNEKLSVPPSSSLSSAASSYSTAEGSSYLESPDFAPSPPRASLLQRAFGRSPPKNSPPLSSTLHQFRNLGRVLETPPGYVEMRPSCKGEMLLTHASSPPNTSGILSPVSPTGSTTSTLTNLTSCSPPNKSQAQPFRIKTGTPPKFIDEDEDPYMDMAPGHVTQQPVSYRGSVHPRPELVTDYMEMNAKRKTSLEEDNNNKRHGNPLKSKPSSFEDNLTQDYMNMNVGHKKDRRKTQPITISSNTSSTNVSSPLSSSRKLSSSTPPKAPTFLPLSNSSPARTTRRKSSLTRRDSKETTTPTIFPFSLNSPAISPAESESPSSNSRLSEPLESVKEVVDSSDYVNFAPDAVVQGAVTVKGDDYVEMQPTPASLSNIAPPALASVAQGKTLEQVQKKLVSLGINKTKKNPSPPPSKEITYESLDLESSSSSCSSLASRTFTSYATIDHSKTVPPNTATAQPAPSVASPKKT
ncbi:hypothetical protein M8J76_014071 [Diaphorina citri]|nr:hypothetical protein M8J76_014071 [Diaphorina citri]